MSMKALFMIIGIRKYVVNNQAGVNESENLNGA